MHGRHKQILVQMNPDVDGGLTAGRYAGSPEAGQLRDAVEQESSLAVAGNAPTVSQKQEQRPIGTASSWASFPCTEMTAE